MVGDGVSTDAARSPSHHLQNSDANMSLAFDSTVSLVTTLLPPWLVAISISPSTSGAMLPSVGVLKVFESGADFCPLG